MFILGNLERGYLHQPKNPPQRQYYKVFMFLCIKNHSNVCFEGFAYVTFCLGQISELCLHAQNLKSVTLCAKEWNWAWAIIYGNSEIRF